MPNKNVVFQRANRIFMGYYITSCSLVTQDELCNEVLNTNAKHECLMLLYNSSWVTIEQQVMYVNCYATFNLASNRFGIQNVRDDHFHNYLQIEFSDF